MTSETARARSFMRAPPACPLSNTLIGGLSTQRPKSSAERSYRAGLLWQGPPKYKPLLRGRTQ